MKEFLGSLTTFESIVAMAVFGFVVFWLLYWAVVVILADYDERERERQRSRDDF